MVSRLCTAPLILLSSYDLTSKFREVPGGPLLGSAAPLYVVLCLSSHPVLH